MRGILGVGLAVYCLIAGGAFAQTIVSQTTTTTTGPAGPVIVAPSLPAPPSGTLSTTRTQYSLQPDGTRTKTNETTYHNTNGVADDTVTRTITVPPPAPPMTSTTDSSTTTVIKK